MNLVIATSNKGKMIEFQEILSAKFDNIFSMREIGITDDILENGNTFAENSLIKARFVKARTPFAVLADDSGLCVDALDGKPGVFSARFAGEHATDADNRKLLLSLLDGAADRTAHFETALTLILPDERIIFAVGKTCGKIAEKEIGERGFGYDSVFFSDEIGKTFAQGSLEEKNKVSHRAKAIINLLEKLK